MRDVNKNGQIPKQEIKIGKFYLSEYIGDKQQIWMEHENGEGMGVPVIIMERVLKNFWDMNL